MAHTFTNEQHSRIVESLIAKGFTRTEAVFLTTCLDAGRRSSSLRDEIGTFGLDQLDAALDRLQGPVDTLPTFGR